MTPDPKGRKRLFALAILILIVGLVCFVLFRAPGEKTVPPAQEAAVEEDALEQGREEGPADLAWFKKIEEEAQVTEDEEEEEESGPIQGEIAPGDTIGALLQQWLSPPQINSLLTASKNTYSLARIRAGQPYLVQLEQGDLTRFEYEIDDTQRLVIVREIEDEISRWKASLEKIAYSVTLIKVEGEIKSNLFESMSKLGERPSLAVRLADIFAWEINFIRDIQPGDSFRMLVEKRYRDGIFKGYGHIPVAEFVNKKKKFEAFHFQDSFGNPAFFTAAGESLRRAFLKAPLAFTRISSHYSTARRHPILDTVRPHLAVDYAAPTGTPVRAIGSGAVAFRGYGQGAGNYISLKHSNGYESMYMHLSGFAKGLKQGGSVRQGEVIGYVGSTGYATGPHLDFRMKRNGQFLNPEKVLSPRDEAVPKNKLEEFKNNRDRQRAILDASSDEPAPAQEKSPND